MSEFNEKKNKSKTSSEDCYQNELMKRRFFEYQRESAGFSEKSIDTYETALLRWQEFTGNEDFRTFDRTRAKNFKIWLSKRAGKSGQPVSLSYQYHTLRKLKGFFRWLALQDTYRNNIKLTDVDLFNLNKKDRRQAIQSGRRKSPTMDQVVSLIESIVPSTEVAMRDRALFCFVLLTGARIDAAISLPIGAFDRDDCVVDQNPKLGVRTKNSKRITTSFFQISYSKAKDYFLEWRDYLVNEKGFKADDPLFPATLKKQGKENVNFYSSGEVGREFWSDNHPARKIFEKRFKAAGLPYFNPHSFRHLIVKECMKLALTEEQKKAISQNLGHANVTTTFGSYGYGQIKEDRQVEILNEISFDELTKSPSLNLSDESIEKLARILKDNK